MSVSKIGYVKLHRMSMENELYFADTFTRMSAWFDLLLLANHKAGKAVIRGNILEVKKGQLAYATKTLASRWKWSRGKVDRFLKYLENEHQIEHQKNSLTTIITIINWDKYQSDEHKTNTKRTSDGHQTDTNNNDKEYIKNIYDDFLEAFVSLTGKKIKTINSKVKSQINARLADDYTLEDFKNAIRNCKSDRYHIENPHFLTPEFITRADKLEKYLHASPKILTSEGFFGVPQTA